MASLNIALLMMRRLLGTKRGFLLNMLLPAIIVSVIAGLVNSASSDQVRLAVVNADKGMLGGYLIQQLAREEVYAIEQFDDTEQGLQDRVNDKLADAAVYIPEDYTERMMLGERPQAIMYRMDVQLWNVSLALMLESEASKLTDSVGVLRADGQEAVDPGKLQALLKIQQERMARTSEGDVKLGTVVTNPIMVGLILMFVLMLVGQSIDSVMEDRELRTMARMFTAPIRAIHISVGYFVGSMLIGTAQLLIVLTMAYYIFGLTLGLTFGELLLVLECFLLAAVGLATALASMVRKGHRLSELNNFIVIPSCMIGGCFWPLSLMPDFMQKLANFTPQKWAMEALDLLGAGAEISDVLLQLGILLLFAVVLISYGAAALKPNKQA